MGNTVELSLTATNAGSETVARLVPEVVFQHDTYRGLELVALAPSADHRWELRLAPVPGPGTFPLTILTRYQRSDGTAGTALLVVLATTPGAPEAGVRAGLSAPPLGRGQATTARLSLSNTLAQPVAGRVAVLLPSALKISPESQPAEVPANGNLELPLVIERRDAEPEVPYSVFALFEFEASGVHHSVLASIILEVPAVSTWEARRPFFIGSAALAFALAVCGVALRLAAARANARRMAESGQ